MESLLSMDIECFSDVDLIKCGVYAYADSPAFEILLFAYSFDGGETQIIDLAQGEQLPAEVEEAIFDVSVTKTAYNANFERTCLSKHFGRYIPPGILALQRGTGGHARPASVTGGRGQGAWAGRAENEGRQGTDPVFLRPLQADQSKWRKEVQAVG